MSRNLWLRLVWLEIERFHLVVFVPFARRTRLCLFVPSNGVKQKPRAVSGGKSVRRESRARRGALPAVEGQAEPKASAPQPRSGDRLVAIRLKPTQDRNGAPQKTCVRVCACLCVCVLFFLLLSLFFFMVPFGV